MRMFKKDEGFTLVELMVVVLIIGILVAVAIPVFNSASNTARARNCQSNQRIIEGAVQQWMGAESSRTLADAAALGVSGLVTDEYIKEAPECPGDSTKEASTDYVIDDTGYTECPNAIGTHAR